MQVAVRKSKNNNVSCLNNYYDGTYYGEIDDKHIVRSVERFTSKIVRLLYFGLIINTFYNIDTFAIQCMQRYKLR